MRNPVHTSETRMCGDKSHNPYTAWRAVHRDCLADEHSEELALAC